MTGASGTPAEYRQAPLSRGNSFEAFAQTTESRRPKADDPKQTTPREQGRLRSYGVDEDRTHNLLDATEALSQLSYHP